MKRAMMASVLLLSAAATPAAAHSPLLDCWVDGDNIHCEAGYSDGASAAGQVIRVRDGSHRLVFEERFDENGVFSFAPPDADEYHVQFEGDQFHSAIIYSTDIE